MQDRAQNTTDDQTRAGEGDRKRRDIIISNHTDKVVTGLVSRQQQKIRYCYDRSNKQMDAFYDCFVDFHTTSKKTIGRIDQAIDWVGNRYNECMKQSRDTSKMDGCVNDYIHNIDDVVSSYYYI